MNYRLPDNIGYIQIIVMSLRSFTVFSLNLCLFIFVSFRLFLLVILPIFSKKS